MNQQVTLIRAIGCEFADRKIHSIAIMIAVLLVLLSGVGAGLTLLSPWWWLLEAPILAAVVVSFLVYLVVRITMKRLRPKLAAPLTESMKQFVDKLERVAENLQTPVFIIIFKIVRDVIRPRGPTFIATVSHDSTTLRHDFGALERIFSTTKKS